MKIKLALLIFFAPFCFLAQETTIETSKFSMGVVFSPNYRYRTLTYSSEGQPLVDEREEIEQPSFGFNTGLVFRYNFMKNLEVELGGLFTRQSHIFKSEELIDVFGYSTIVEVKNKLRYHYIEIPMRLNYRWIDKEVFSYFTVGASAGQFFNDNSKALITYSSGDTEVFDATSGVQNFNETVVGVMGGVGVGFYLNDMLSLRIEPLYRYSLTPIAESAIEQNNYSWGCQVGLNVKL